ncbi:MAG TPA: galactokinase [Armatimonadota bacterium]|nr:galactokinase [Armatimonadota bacterium]
MTGRIAALRDKFRELYGTEPQTITKGPGRVDLMGIHTDYNEGFVLPVAISFEVLAAGRLRDDNIIRAYSENLKSLVEFSLDDLIFDKVDTWSNYLRGMLVFLKEAGVELRGADIAVEGNVPVGASLSSSAAIEMATGTLFQAMLGFEMSGPELALIGQKAENKFVGVNSGIMDQFISRLGKKDHALFLDCRTLDYELLPLDTGAVKIVICDTMKRRGLVDSEYNTRRSQCEKAVELLSQWLPGIKALRDVTPEDFEKYADRLPEDVRKRAKHVISENARVLASREALINGRIEDLAVYMNQGHDSARDYYEVSCFELEAMVEASRNAPGSLCGRLCGAGFGGATVSLVREDSIDDFMKVTAEKYREKTGIEPKIYVCTAENGAGVIV